MDERMGATSATALPNIIMKGLDGPLLAGFGTAPFRDLEAVKQLIDWRDCAILIPEKPIQGKADPHSA